MNKVILCGRLGRDPEVAHTQTGSAVSKFSLATTEHRKTGKHTEWHQIEAWGKTGEVAAQYLKKGSEAIIEGSNKTTEWEDKSGNKRRTTVVNAQKIEFVGSRQSSEPQQSLKQSFDNVKAVEAQESFSVDEIPF